MHQRSINANCPHDLALFETPWELCYRTVFLQGRKSSVNVLQVIDFDRTSFEAILSRLENHPSCEAFDREEGFSNQYHVELCRPMLPILSGYALDDKSRVSIRYRGSFNAEASLFWRLVDGPFLARTYLESSRSKKEPAELILRYGDALPAPFVQLGIKGGSPAYDDRKQRRGLFNEFLRLAGLEASEVATALDEANNLVLLFSGEKATYGQAYRARAENREKALQESPFEELVRDNERAAYRRDVPRERWMEAFEHGFKLVDVNSADTIRRNFKRLDVYGYEAREELRVVARRLRERFTPPEQTLSQELLFSVKPGDYARLREQISPEAPFGEGSEGTWQLSFFAKPSTSPPEAILAGEEAGGLEESEGADVQTYLQAFRLSTPETGLIEVDLHRAADRFGMHFVMSESASDEETQEAFHGLVAEIVGDAADVSTPSADSLYTLPAPQTF